MRRQRQESPVGEVLATVEGRDLEGRERRIPDDLDAPAWLFIAHIQSQQPQVDAWMDVVADSGLTALEAPVMQRRWRMASRVIEGGMASNMPREIRLRTICVYADVDAWRAQRGFPPEPTVTALLLDADGVIRWVAHGPPTPAGAASAAAALAGLTSDRS